MVGGRRLLVDTLVDTLEATKWFRSNLRSDRAAWGCSLKCFDLPCAAT
jgi:hypothetical protein